MVDNSSQKGAAKLEWSDPGFFADQSRVRNALRVVKQLVKPAQGHKTLPTTAGVILIVLSLGIGSAAYNTSSNILFISLALLLSSLILSGVLSWLNFKGMRWRMVLQPHLRAREITPVRLELENTKSYLPSYCLLFDLRALQSGDRERLFLHDRVDAGGKTRLEWMFEPRRRGTETITLAGVESQFPFGFLRKIIPGRSEREVVVWPARVDYTFLPMSGYHGRDQAGAVKRQGQGMELINMRDYVQGDPIHSIHWKASARSRRLMVRETAEEHHDSYLIWVRSEADRWTDPEQFERLCEFSASLAEDLFMHNRLWGAAINADPVMPFRRLGELHSFLEQLARLEVAEDVATIPESTGVTVITFEPGEQGGVDAFVGGNAVGQARREESSVEGAA